MPVSRARRTLIAAPTRRTALMRRSAAQTAHAMQARLSYATGCLSIGERVPNSGHKQTAARQHALHFCRTLHLWPLLSSRVLSGCVEETGYTQNASWS